MPCRLRPAELSDVPALAALYASAFEDNAAYASIFQLRSFDPQRHAQALAWLFTKRVSLTIKAGATYLVIQEEQHGAEQPRVLAAGALLRISSQPTLWDMVMEGLLEWPFRWGLPSLFRALALDGELLDVPSGGVAPLAQLQMVAVAPGAQGEGVGSELVSALLESWDRRGGGRVVLSTQRARNLAFYQRRGFVLTKESDQDGYTSWALRRDAQVAAPA